MTLLGYVACDFLFISLYLCNYAYINKMELSSFIFVLDPSKAFYMVRSKDSIMWPLIYKLNVTLELVCKNV